MNIFRVIAIIFGVLSIFFPLWFYFKYKSEFGWTDIGNSKDIVGLMVYCSMLSIVLSSLAVVIGLASIGLYWRKISISCRNARFVEVGFLAAPALISLALIIRHNMS